MKILVDYKKVKKVWRHKLREVYIPVYKDIGRGASKPKTMRSKER